MKADLRSIYRSFMRFSDLTLHPDHRQLDVLTRFRARLIAMLIILITFFSGFGFLANKFLDTGHSGLTMLSFYPPVSLVFLLALRFTRLTPQLIGMVFLVAMETMFVVTLAINSDGTGNPQHAAFGLAIAVTYLMFEPLPALIVNVVQLSLHVGMLLFLQFRTHQVWVGAPDFFSRQGPIVLINTAALTGACVLASQALYRFTRQKLADAEVKHIAILKMKILADLASNFSASSREPINALHQLQSQLTATKDPEAVKPLLLAYNATIKELEEIARSFALFASANHFSQLGSFELDTVLRHVRTITAHSLERSGCQLHIRGSVPGVQLRCRMSQLVMLVSAIIQFAIENQSLSLELAAEINAEQVILHFHFSVKPPRQATHQLTNLQNVLLPSSVYSFLINDLLPASGAHLEPRQAWQRGRGALHLCREALDPWEGAK